MTDPKDYLTVGVAKDIFTIKDKHICLAKYPQLKLQVLKIRVIPVKDGEMAKLRFTLSDGNYSFQSVYSHTNADIDSLASQIQVGAVIKVPDYEAFVMPPNKPVLLFDTWEIVNPAMGKLGSPEVLKISEGGEQIKSESSAPSNNIDNNTSAMGGGSGSIIPKEERKSEPKPASKPVPSAARSSSNKAVTPIESLSPYSNSWTIRARVTLKSDVRNFTSQRGAPGKLFNVNLLDESSEIRATGFTDAVDKFYDLFQEGSVYYISKASVVLANKKFATLPNEYEIRFERDTEVEKCTEQVDVPQMQYNFVKLDDLSSCENNTNIDVIGVIKTIDDVQEITSKAGNNFEKREVHIVDKSNYGVNVTLWGKSAKSFQGQPGAIVALKGARVNDFNGKSLSVSMNTHLTYDPDIAEAHSLKGWFDNGGRDQNFNSHKNANRENSSLSSQPTITIAKAKEDNLGQSETGDYFNLKATITYIKSTNLTYPACTTEGCKKKVIEETTGEFRCEKCNLTISQPNFLFIFNPCVEDHTGRIWLSSFNETGEKILGITGNELVAADNDDKVNEVIANAMGYEYIFRVRARPDTFNDQTGVRYQALSIAPVNYQTESAKLIDLINKY